MFTRADVPFVARDSLRVAAATEGDGKHFYDNFTEGFGPKDSV